MRRPVHDRSVPRWLLGALALGGTAVWLAATVAVVASIYARDAVLATIGLPATLALVTCFLAPLVGVYLYADEIRSRIDARVRQSAK